MRPKRLLPPFVIMGPPSPSDTRPDDLSATLRLASAPFRCCRGDGPLQNAPRAHGFTLVETLVTVAIIAVVAAIALSVVDSGLRKSREARCLSNLRQLHLAWAQFAADNNGRLVSPGWKNSKSNIGPGASPGLREYVGLGSASSYPTPYFSTVFTCPDLQADPKTATKEAFFRTYSINYRATDPTWDGVTAAASDQRTRVIAIRNPSRMALFMDGGLNPANSPNDRYTQTMRNDKGRAIMEMLQRPHHGHGHVVYADGHVGAIPEEAYTDQSTTSLFWRDGGR